MKLRVRALESKQTIGIEIPDDSSLQNLKQSIAQAIQFPSPYSLRLSLNRTDDISPSSPDDSLLSLGIAAGDIVFYSVVADGVSTSAQEGPIPTQVISQDPTSSVSGESEEQESDVLVLDEEATAIDEEFDKLPPVSCFVKRLVTVLSDNLGEKDIQQKWIIGAVHSVFVESGFVLLSDEKLQFPSSMAFTMSLHYTLPQIVSASKAPIKSVVLKFQTMKSFVIVYGNLTKPSPGSTFRICLDSLRFAPVVSSLRSAAAAANAAGEGLEREAFELWKIVRDSLVLPLKIDLCAWAGLAGPACFSRLPAALLTRILELLPGRDVARAGSICRELDYLARDDGLWRRKFREEFGVAAAAPAAGRGKSAFEEWWRWRRRERRAPHPVWHPAFWVRPMPYIPIMVPIIGVARPPFGGGGRGRDLPRPAPPYRHLGGRRGGL